MNSVTITVAVTANTMRCAILLLIVELSGRLGLPFGLTLAPCFDLRFQFLALLLSFLVLVLLEPVPPEERSGNDDHDGADGEIYKEVFHAETLRLASRPANLTTEFGLPLAPGWDYYFGHGAENPIRADTAPDRLAVFSCPRFMPGAGEYKTLRGNKPAVSLSGSQHPAPTHTGGTAMSAETERESAQISLGEINPLAGQDVRDTISAVTKVMDVLEHLRPNDVPSPAYNEGMAWLMHTMSSALRVHLKHGTTLPSGRLVFVSETKDTGPKLVGGAS